MSTVVQHSSKSNEHYTPLDYVEAAREVMGKIDLDPATTAIVNRDNVKARAFITEDIDGLAQQWNGNVFLNPPGGVVRTGKRPRSRSAIWWAKLVEEYELGNVTQAIFVGFTLEIIRTSQSESPLSVIHFPCCFPKDRICFLHEVEGSDELAVGNDPGHANVITFLPPRDDDFETAEAIERFQKVFSKFGIVR